MMNSDINLKQLVKDNAIDRKDYKLYKKQRMTKGVSEFDSIFLLEYIDGVIYNGLRQYRDTFNNIHPLHMSQKEFLDRLDDLIDLARELNMINNFDIDNVDTYEEICANAYSLRMKLYVDLNDLFSQIFA